MLPRIRTQTSRPDVDDDCYGDLGYRISARRETLGLSKQDLARKLGTTVSWVIDLERSGWRWRNKSLIRVATVLEMPQLELAIAAGVVSDLPTYPSRPIEPDESTIEDRYRVQGLLGGQSLEVEATRQEAVELLRTLSIEELRFVLAVIEQLVER